MTLTLAQAQAAGLRPPIGAVTQSLWSFFANATTPEKQQRLAGELVKYLAPPGRGRIVALGALMTACPMSTKPAVLRVLRTCNPGRAEWQTVILYSWLIDRISRRGRRRL